MAEYNEDLGIQVLNLIRKFVYANIKLCQKPTVIETDEVINTAWIDIMENYIPKWDKNRGKLSTYLYNILDHNIYIYVKQIRCGMSKTLVKYVFSGDNTKRGEKIKNIYEYIESLDTCKTAIDSPFQDEKDSRYGKSIVDNNLADPDNDIDILIDKLTHSDFMVAFENYLDDYVTKKKIPDKEKYSDIIKRRLIKKETLKSIGDYYGLSDERIRQICKKFVWCAKRDKTLKSIAKS